MSSAPEHAFNPVITFRTHCFSQENTSSSPNGTGADLKWYVSSLKWPQSSSASSIPFLVSGTERRTLPAVSPWVPRGSPVGPCLPPAAPWEKKAARRHQAGFALVADERPDPQQLGSTQDLSHRQWHRHYWWNMVCLLAALLLLWAQPIPTIPWEQAVVRNSVEGNQAAPFLIPALLLHQPLPRGRLMSLSGHCMVARGNIAHQTTLRMVPCQSPACAAQLLLTDKRLSTTRVFHHNRNVGWSSALG